MKGSDDFGTLEEVEPFGAEGPSPTLEPEDAPCASKALVDLMDSYSIVPMPVAMLDEGLSFIYKNGPFEAIMESFHYARGQSFLGTIGYALDMDTARTLKKSLSDPKRGYTWKGLIRHSSPDARTVITKATIIPFRSGGAKPEAWSVFFDDVTEEDRRYLRGPFVSLLEASKLKDNDTGRHIERVNLYAECLSKAMYGDQRYPEVDMDFVDNIGFLAAMHDVGKIGTPDDILNKKGPLNEFEWGIMKEHTINGAFILGKYPNPMAKQIAQSHHEWWNGSGYPYRLMGDMIPLAARIVALADVYDALRMKRSYKAPFDHRRASLLIEADAGTHFDPELVRIYKRVETKFDEIYAANADEP